MSKIIKETLEPKASLRVASSNYLLIRDASTTVMLRLDTEEPVEVKRNDVIPTQGYTMLELTNHHDVAVDICYQAVAVPINTQSDITSIAGAVEVSEIKEPVTVDSVLNPVQVSEVQSEVNVRVQNDTLTVEQLAELYTLQKIGTGQLALTGNEQTIAANANRKGLFIQASADNANPVLVQGFIDVAAGGHVLIKSDKAVTLEGVAGDGVRVGEFI
ncbi:hypothetical protein HJA60_004286 [Vibrio vulnificus]|nr:hypothetical protein [Vibrio vulnificus]